jgi:hypothetical protein
VAAPAEAQTVTEGEVTPAGQTQSPAPKRKKKKKRKPKQSPAAALPDRTTAKSSAAASAVSTQNMAIQNGNAGLQAEFNEDPNLDLDGNLINGPRLRHNLESEVGFLRDGNKHHIYVWGSPKPTGPAHFVG